MVTQDVITLSVGQVIDLALNSPEVGAVNFNLLHSVLHIIAKQLQMQNTNVEFRGKDGEKIKMLVAAASGRRSSSVLLTEFAITSDAKGNKTRTEVTHASKDSKPVESTSSATAEKKEVVVLVQQDTVQTPQMTVCLSEKTIVNIQNDINDLKQHVEQLIDLPKNRSLMDAMKNKEKPLVEMFQIMNLAKRIDATEAGLHKLGSLVEDLADELQVTQLQAAFGDGYNEEEGYEGGNETDQTNEAPESARSSPTNVPAKGKHDSQVSEQKTEPAKGKTEAAKEKGETAREKAETAKEKAETAKEKAETVKEKAESAKRKEQPTDVKSKNESQKTKDAEHPTVSSQKHSPTLSMAQSRKSNDVRSPGKKPPVELLNKIVNCERRIQTLEDTIKDSRLVPLSTELVIKYPSKNDLSPMDMKPPTGATEAVGTTSSPPAVPSPVSPTYSPKGYAGPPPVHPLISAGEEVLAAMQKDINKIKREIRKLKSSNVAKDTDDSGPSSKYDRKKGRKSQAHDENQLGDLETKVRDSADTLVSIDQNFNNQILQLQNNFSILEMEVNNIMEKLTAALPGGDTGVESIGDLCKKIQAMQIDIENIAETTATLVEDLATKKTSFESLNETVELLKTIKADKEDLEDALADKADKCAINRKVSHDQFDTACDELSRGIEEALEKLTTQELLWQQALDEIQFEISNKLDKMELGPLRDFINNKLRMLQERMKSLTALKKEQEAAGTKSKFLRNVNCISCDKDVVMRKQMDAALMPQPRALPPNRSMAPYLAYELDALRKQQKTLANSRNLNHFENAITCGKSTRMDDHVCNRYCGGSHTVTTPQQRVTRMGHFLAQWGPGAVPVTDTVPTKEEPKQEKKSSMAEQGDQKKADVKDEGTPSVATQPVEQKSIRGSSVKSGSIAPKPTPEESKGRTPSMASGPGGDEKRISGSQEKVRTSIGSARSSQKSAKKRGSKGSVAVPAKGSKQGSVAEVVPDENAKEVPEEIPEETPSEVAAADQTVAEPNDEAPAQNEEPVEEAENAAEGDEEVNPQVEPENAE